MAYEKLNPKLVPILKPVNERTDITDEQKGEIARVVAEQYALGSSIVQAAKKLNDALDKLAPTQGEYELADIKNRLDHYLKQIREAAGQSLYDKGFEAKIAGPVSLSLVELLNREAETSVTTQTARAV